MLRKIFELYAAGKSYAQILRAINGAIGKRGRPLGKNSLHSILTNERYIGTYTWCKRVVKTMGKWAGGAPSPRCVEISGGMPRIIDDETWKKVQERMQDNKRNASNKAKREYLLSGLIECSTCGATYICHTYKKGPDYERRVYVCGNKYRTRTCHAKNINADTLEECVIASVRTFLKETDFTEHAKSIASQINAASTSLEAEKKELADIDSQINNGVKAMLSGMDIPELRDELDRLRIRKSDLEDIIAHNQKGKKASPEKIESLLNSAAKKIDDPASLREAVQTLVSKIYAQPDGSCTIQLGVHTIGASGDIELFKNESKIKGLRGHRTAIILHSVPI